MADGNLISRDAKAVWHPFTQYLTEPEMLPIVRAEGIWLHDGDGNRYMDVNGSWWVNLYGHGNPAITEAISAQAKQLDHVIFAGITHEPAITLAEGLLNMAGFPFAKVFYSDNGSTAVEVALKMALQYHHNLGDERRLFVAFEGAYHGDTFGAMSVGGRDTFNKPFEALMFDVAFLPLPNEANITEIENEIDRLIATNTVAGFIYEPLIQGAAGMRVYAPMLLERLLNKFRQAGIFLIADEVFTGFGRTGKLLASHHMATMPDIIALSKGLTGGVIPLGATLATQTIFDAFLHSEKRKGFLHGHSFTANPIACAAANASLMLLYSSQIQASIDWIAKQHQEFVTKITQHSRVLNAASCGTVLRVEIKTSNGGGYADSIRGSIYDYFIKKGLLLRPLGNILYVNPPYVISPEEIRLVYTAIESFLD